MGSFIMVILLFCGFLVVSSIKILKEFERGVVLRLGRLQGARGPGIVIVIPGIETMYRIDMRTVTLDVPS